MKILLVSHVFFPNIGGLEAVSRILAIEFSRAGNEVVVVTQTAAQGEEIDDGYAVVRCPSPRALLRLHRWAELVFHNNISLRAGWPLLLVWRPWVVAHHIWFPRGKVAGARRAGLKRFVLRFATQVAVSKALAASFGQRCEVISNPYDSEVFRRQSSRPRTTELVFVGRLIADKGLPVLFDALVMLADEGLFPALTVVGSGGQEASLKRTVERLGLGRQVVFAGVKRGSELSGLLNAHRIMVVPSLWDEPFGVVALEGIACGCVVVGSDGGGLPEAIGGAGLTFPNGDVSALASQLKKVLTDPRVYERCRSNAAAQLARHTPRVVARQYLELFANAVA